MYQVVSTVGACVQVYDVPSAPPHTAMRQTPYGGHEWRGSYTLKKKGSSQLSQNGSPKFKAGNAEKDGLKVFVSK
jgi:hypothetical protein